jgi:hypothetical protein
MGASEGRKRCSLVSEYIREMRIDPYPDIVMQTVNHHVHRPVSTDISTSWLSPLVVITVQLLACSASLSLGPDMY